MFGIMKETNKVFFEKKINELNIFDYEQLEQMYLDLNIEIIEIPEFIDTEIRNLASVMGKRLSEELAEIYNDKELYEIFREIKDDGEFIFINKPKRKKKMLTRLREVSEYYIENEIYDMLDYEPYVLTDMITYEKPDEDVMLEFKNLKNLKLNPYKINEKEYDLYNKNQLEKNNNIEIYFKNLEILFTSLNDCIEYKIKNIKDNKILSSQIKILTNNISEFYRFVYLMGKNIKDNEEICKTCYDIFNISKINNIIFSNRIVYNINFKFNEKQK